MGMLIKKQEDGKHEEVLLEVLHLISHCCEDENADQGSYLSDLWHLCGYKVLPRPILVYFSSPCNRFALIWFS